MRSNLTQVALRLRRRRSLGGLAATAATLGSTTVMAATVLATALASPATLPGPICSLPKSTATGGYGTVRFANSCSAAVQPALQLAIAKLHSFEAEPSDFVGVARREPACAIAWWGAAMSARGNPLGGSLDRKSISLGRYDVKKAKAVASSARERALIDAMDVYYRDYPDTIARGRAYADVMDKARAAYPDDADVAALDGLAIIEGVDLDDKTFARQRRAGAILEAVMAAHPDHPGAPHYLIHAYDYTALAPQATRAAELEAQLSPASSHAQHMPSHIWSMLGAWNKSIDSNRRSSFLADPGSQHDTVKGDIVFGHAFDFIAYARLQKGDDGHVGSDLAALKASTGMPTIVVARYALERGDWADAARVPLPRDSFDAALARFARAYGAARAGDVAQATTELAALKALRQPVAAEAGEYWGVFVDIYVAAAEGWLHLARHEPDAALKSLRAAADKDDGHEKHIYLENKILPMRESLGDMQAALGQPHEALASYEASLALAPNRYRSFLGAMTAARASGDKQAARQWAAKLLDLARDGDHDRPGWVLAEAVASNP